MAAPTGRPAGTGDTWVRLAPRDDQGGYRLFIGRARWQQIGSPARVSLRRIGSWLVIRPGAHYAVTGTATNGQPRIAIGEEAVARLGIEGRTYYSHVARTGRAILVRI